MKIPKKIKKALFSIVLTMTVVASNIPMSFAQKSNEPKGYVTITAEKFTLGLGYIQEPIKVPFYEGDTYADITLRALGQENLKYEDSAYGFYLNGIRDDDDREPEVPEYILEQCGSVDSRQEEGWLSAFDYTFMSGWMYAVDNEFPNYGAGNWYPEDGDVCRWQFTTYGYGLDIGSGGFAEGMDPYYDVANRDELTEEVAEINSSKDKNDLLKDKEIKQAYDDAYEVLEDLTSTQEDVDNAYQKLNEAVDNKADTPEKPGDSTTTPEKPGNSNTTPEKPEDSNSSIVIPQISVNESITKSSTYMYQNTPNPAIGTNGGEWTVLSLARGGYEVGKDYYNTYYKNVVNKLKEKDGVLDKTKYTEYSRVILGLTAIGKDPSNVGGYNLLEKLADYNNVKKQGINGPIYALIALDSNNYKIPQVEGVSKQTTRDNLIEYILDKEITQKDGTVGGWALSGTSPDPDVTAMALQALSNYKDKTITKEDGSKEDVKPYIDRALSVLSKIQLENGGYTSWGSENVESAAQVLVALTSLGIDPKTDERFIKGDGNWLVSNIMEYQTNDGGFEHIKGKGTNGMATDQATYALVAYKRFVEGKTKLYDMSDVVKDVQDLKENEVKLEVPSKISGEKGTEFKITLRAGDWLNDNIKLLDSIIDIPSSVSIEKVEASKNLTGGDMYFGVDSDNKLRIAYTNTDLSPISFEAGDLMTLTCKLKEDLKNTRSENTLTFKVNEVNLKDSSENSTKLNILNDTITIEIGDASNDGEQNPDVPEDAPDQNPEIKLVSVKDLYQGDGTDLIPDNKKAIAISLLNVEGNKEISFKDDVKLYYSQELTNKLSNTTYVALVDTSISQEELNNINNYKVNKENQSETVVFGNTNNDEILNAQDALNILSTWTRKSDAPNDKGIISMNVTADSKIDTSDALAILERYIENKEFLILSK